MHNVSVTEGRLLWQVRPALQTQAFFETRWGQAADDHQLFRDGLRALLLSAPASPAG